MKFNDRESIIAITPEWKGERFPDGRPKVADKYLDALYKMTLEELWKPIFVRGYENQFIAMKSVYPEFTEDGDVKNKLVGRAVTAVYAPTRPDYYAAACAIASAQGWHGTPNQWVIDSLVDRDVLVVDMYDKIYKGTFIGGNLATALASKTHSGGAADSRRRQGGRTLKVKGPARPVSYFYIVKKVNLWYDVERNMVI